MYTYIHTIYIYICIYVYIIHTYEPSKSHVGMLVSPYFRGVCLAICFKHASIRGVSLTDNKPYQPNEIHRANPLEQYQQYFKYYMLNYIVYIEYQRLYLIKSENI